MYLQPTGFGANTVMFPQGLPEGPFLHNENLQFEFLSYMELYSDSVRVDTRSAISTAVDAGTSFHTPICRQFWKAGNYEESYTKTTCQNGSSYLRVHPRFLHSNATSHKWIFGAMAELLDNAVDEVQNGATFVTVDKILNPRDKTPALLIQDDGCGMNPVAMRSCLSFGFSNKDSATAIGQYGNGFKTSSMRLGADVIVFSRSMRDRKLTQSVGLLSYTFLMQTKQDTIVVPMLDYEFDDQGGAWNALYNNSNFKANLSLLLQWSPFTTEAELLEQCDYIEDHGTRIIIYNLWHNDEGIMELDFESDPEDILISRSGDSEKAAKVSFWSKVHEQHLANRLQHSLRAYLSILYFNMPNFHIILRGRVVDYHNIANDLKFPEFIEYKPQNVEGSIITAIGFLKEAPAVNIHGFNVYHKNRLIMPFWHVVSVTNNRGRGVVGVLEADFLKPVHNKQDFEKTPTFHKLEARLKAMTNEYWDYHCGLIGYSCTKLKPPPSMLAVCGSSPSIMPPFHQFSQGSSFKRKELHSPMESDRVRMGVEGYSITDSGPGGVVQDVIDLSEQVRSKEAANLIRQNKRLRTRCWEYEKAEEELCLKLSDLVAQVEAAKQERDELMRQIRVK